MDIDELLHHPVATDAIDQRDGIVRLVPPAAAPSDTNTQRIATAVKIEATAPDLDGPLGEEVLQIGKEIAYPGSALCRGARESLIQGVRRNPREPCLGVSTHREWLDLRLLRLTL